MGGDSGQQWTTTAEVCDAAHSNAVRPINPPSPFFLGARWWLYNKRVTCEPRS